MNNLVSCDRKVHDQIGWLYVYCHGYLSMCMVNSYQNLLLELKSLSETSCIGSSAAVSYTHTAGIDILYCPHSHTFVLIVLYQLSSFSYFHSHCTILAVLILILSFSYYTVLILVLLFSLYYTVLILILSFSRV